MREIVKVIRDGWYPSYDESGKDLFSVTYRETNGLLYMQAVMARDELDAVMQVMKEEQTNGYYC